MSGFRRVRAFWAPAVSAGYRNWRVALARVLVDALALALTVLCLPGIGVEGEPAVSFLVAAVILGALNALVKPLLQFLLFPFLFVSYGLVIVGLNMLVLLLLEVVAGGLITIGGAGWLVAGGVLVSFFALLLENLFGVWPPIGSDRPEPAREPRRVSRLPAVEESLRLQQVYNTLLRYGMDLLVDRGAVGSFRRRMQALLYRPEPPLAKLTTATKVRLMLEELGPTYVKVGQLASSQTNVLPDEWERELARLQSTVPPFSAEEARVLVKEELGAPPEELFERFDARPFAAASLAQVHEATLRTGERVVVKVQRPTARTQVTADLGIIRGGTRMLARRVSWAREVGVPGIVEEFGRNLTTELDYGAEAYNARRLVRILEPIEGVSVPTIHPELSAARVLTMGFVEGVKITDVATLDAAGIDREDVADRALAAAIKMLLVDGFFHADPHPGNVIVDTETGAVTFIDTGMVGQLSREARLGLLKLLVVGQAQDLTGVAKALEDLSEPFREVDQRSFYREFERKLGPYLEPEGRAAFAEAMTTALDVLRDHGLRLDPDLTLALKALAQAAAFTSALLPEASNYSFFARGLGIAEELLLEELDPERVADAAKQRATVAGIDLLKSLPTLEGGARRWLEQLAEGHVTVKLDTSDLERQVESARHTARSVSLGVLLAGILIASAVAASVGSLGGAFLDFLPKFALVTYTVSVGVAVIVALVLVVRIARRSQGASPPR